MRVTRGLAIFAMVVCLATVLSSAAMAEFVKTPIQYNGGQLEHRIVNVGDIDSDGDFDLLLELDAGGLGVLINDNMTFSNMHHLDTSTRYPVLMDFDYDGDLDVVSGSTATILDNGVPTGEQIPCGQDNNECALVDINCDGELDMLGTSRSSADTLISVRTGNLFSIWPFSDYDPSYKNRYGFFGAADFDLDGDNDLAYYANVAINEGNGHFTRYNFLENWSYTRYASSWGDYDSDGDPDLLMHYYEWDTINGRSYGISTLFENNGGVLSETETDIFGIYKSHSGGISLWGDLDNDGDLDLILTGETSWSYPGLDYEHATKILINDNGVFSQEMDLVEDGELIGMVLVDFDADGDLDVFSSGSKCVFINDTTQTNSAPQPPHGLLSSVTGSSVRLSWNAPTDDKSTQQSLQYNLRVGTSPGAQNIMASQADLSDGHLLLPQTVNAGSATLWKLQGLEPGTYYWSVQAVDCAYAASTWSEEHTFIISETGLITISGVVETTDGTPLADLPVLSDDINVSTQTGSDGSYSLQVASGFSGQVIVGITDDDYLFYPESIEYENIQSDQTSQNFTAYDTTKEIDSVFVRYSFTTQNMWQLLDFDNNGYYDYLTDLAWESDLENPYEYCIALNDADGWELFFTGLPKLSRGYPAWKDYDNDGDLDAAIFGNSKIAANSYEEYGAVIRNDGDHLTVLDCDFTQFSTVSQVDWVDINNDGMTDLFVYGDGPNGWTLEFYINMGGSFTRSSIYIQPKPAGFCSFADYDGDGDTDFIYSGPPAGSDFSDEYVDDFYENIGGSYSEAPLPSGAIAREPNIFRFDFDNDGDFDSWDNTEWSNDVMANCGDYSRETIWAQAMGDVDGDLNIEFIRLYGNHLQIVSPEIPIQNTRPQPPVITGASQDGDKVTFNWATAFDAETQACDLTYNIRVGTTPGGCDIISPGSNATTGFILQPVAGNAGNRLFSFVCGVQSRELYWSVQTIDGAYIGSEWAPEQTITLTGNTVSGHVLTSSGEAVESATVVIDSRTTGVKTNELGYYELFIGELDTVTVTCTMPGEVFEPRSHSYSGVTSDIENVDFILHSNEVPGLANGSLAWGDYDGDGDHDLIACGSDSTDTYLTQLFRNDGGDLIATSENFVPIGRRGTVAWCDYDLDGDLDLAIAGETTGGSDVCKIYRNDSGTFAEAYSYNELDNPIIAWGDIDVDGDMDLTYTGKNGANILQNNSGMLIKKTANIAWLGNGSAQWFDIDSDGDQDLTICGDLQVERDTVIYLNNGGVLEELANDIPGIASGQLAWCVNPNTGDPMLAICGYTTTLGPQTYLYSFTGGAISLVQKLDGVQSASLAWADADGDGICELAVSGDSYSLGESLRIYTYNAGSDSYELEETLTGLDHGDVAWGYLNGDLLPELMVTGLNDNGAKCCHLYNFESSTGNTPPLPPYGLVATSISSGLELTWQPGADNSGIAGNLFYNIRVGTAPGASDVISPQTVTSGQKLVPDFGNTGSSRTKMVSGLSPGTYYWSVQTIDGSFAPSDWATESTFEVLPVSAHAAKQYSENTSLALEPMVCTYREPAMFYLENTDRTSGIRVHADRVPFGKGSIVAVTGVLKINDDGEVYIQSSDLSVNGRGTIAPLLMNNRTIGGGTTGLQEKMTGWDTVWNEELEDWERIWADEEGLSTVGLYVRTYGAFTYIDQYSFTIDDGYEVPIKCEVPPLAGIRLDQNWTYVVVNGVVSCERVGDELHRKILIDSAANITPITP